MGKVTRVLIYNRGVLERGAALVSSVQCLCPVSSACVECSGHSPDLRHHRLAARVRVSGSKSNFFFFRRGFLKKGVKEICYSGFAEHVKRGRRGSQDEDSSFEDGSGGGESPLQRAISPRGPPPHQMDHVHPRLSGAHGDSKYSVLAANHFLFPPLFSIYVVLLCSCMQL